MRDVESMRAVARAHQNRNLGEFEKALHDYKHGWCFENLKVLTSDFPDCRALIRSND
jgi:hypothetical protein